MYLLYWFNSILSNILLASDREQAIPVEIATTSKPIPVTNRIVGLDIAPVITIESIDSNNEVSVLYFFYLFSDLLFFVFEVTNHLLNAIN